MIHRDISEGNVMMARRSARFRGFIQDFDYSFSWRQFLRKRGMEISLAAWEKYCEEHGHEPRSNDKPDTSKERTVSGLPSPLGTSLTLLLGYGAIHGHRDPEIRDHA